MAIPTVQVGGKVTAAETNLLVGGVNGVALAGIVPASVAGTGVTVTPNGQVTAINAAVVSFNGVFTGSYDNYRITWNSNNRSTITTLQFRLRRSGADVVTNNYDYVKGVDSGTTRAVTSSSSTGTVPLDQAIATGQYSAGVMDLFGPALSQSTLATVQSTILASSALTSCQLSFAQEDASPSDGFTVYPLAGSTTFSGIFRVYGYNTLT